MRFKIQILEYENIPKSLESILLLSYFITQSSILIYISHLD